ncbi:MAG: OFA family MFS transporter [Atribacterota bacterium]|nr:OFA family MFS transporter [Atribacterota bacterium]
MEKYDEINLRVNLKRGWMVTFAGLGVNLALGVLYSWGVFASALRTEGWSATESQIPYMIACAVFAIIMVPGGHLQDNFGPKKVIFISATLTGIAFILSGFFMTVIGLSIFFGIVFGTAMGFGYAAVTPAAIKWFGPHKRGLISGIVVSGYGLAGIYIAPLTTYLIEHFGLGSTFFIIGICFAIAIFLFNLIIDNPPADYHLFLSRQNIPIQKIKNMKNYTWKEMINTPQFYMLWSMFCFGTFAGLLILGQLSNIAQEQTGITAHTATSFVMIYAVFNWFGRLACGLISDKAGRKSTFFLIFLIQFICFVFFARFVTLLSFSIGTALVAFSFGGMLTLFPSTTADYFGVKNLGLNYGLVFTAWGAGGVFGPLLGGLARDLTGTYNVSYLVSAVLCLMGATISLLMPAIQRK